MSDVFISYAHEDRKWAMKLAETLQAKGWSVWWDRNIITGQAFDQSIEQELDTASAVTVLWSRHSVASEWVKNEAASAAERGVLVPAMIEQIKLPLEFRRRQTADLTGWHGDPGHGGLQALCDGLTVVISGKMPLKLHEASPYTSKKPWWQERRKWLTAAILAMILGGGVFWFVGRGPTSFKPIPAAGSSTSYRKDIYNTLGRAQYEALSVMGQDKARAIALIDQNMNDIDKALQSFPNDTDFLVLKGYAAKNVYQSSKNLLDVGRRRIYLNQARKSFENALETDRNNAGAHNGLGNVLFFEGKYDEAIDQHDIALRLTNGQYPAAKEDKDLVERVKKGEVTIDF
jgi:tetratricopeptide (TPR) repeat protein